MTGAIREDLSLDRFLGLLDALPRPSDAEFLFDASDPAGALRRRNLLRYLRLIRAGGADRMLLSEAPGWRGMTFTGVPWFAMRELECRPGLITGDPEGDGFEPPADAPVRWEASSRDLWAAMERRRGPVPLFWPVYPHHPHVPGRTDTNRPPRTAEVRDGVAVALALREAFGGLPLVAVGRQAQKGLASAGIEVPVIRHPARGGAALFAEQALALGI